MIHVHTWRTPNGRKVAIMLAETGLEHVVHPVDISKGDQFEPDFLAISPNNKIPAIVDEDGPQGSLAIFETGAILTYLAERSGRLLPQGAARWAVLEWLYWSIGGVGPMLGQLGYYAVRAEEKAPLPIARFTKEGERLLGVLERRLAASPFVGGDDYSIADISTYTWIAEARGVMGEPLGGAFAASPRVLDWLTRVGARPAVEAGMALLKDA